MSCVDLQMHWSKGETMVSEGVNIEKIDVKSHEKSFEKPIISWNPSRHSKRLDTIEEKDLYRR